VLHVDQRRVSRLGSVIPLAGRGFAARILGRRDDFEILVFQFVI